MILIKCEGNIVGVLPEPASEKEIDELLEQKENYYCAECKVVIVDEEDL